MNHVEKLRIRYQAARMLVVALFLTLLILAGLLLAEIRKEPPRYIVYVDDLGIARVIEPIDQVESAERRFLLAELRRMMINARSISTDATVTARKMSAATAFLTDELRRLVMAQLRGEAPPARRDVEILSILSMETENRFLIRWRETTYQESILDRPAVESWEAYITVSIAQVLDEHTLLVNPLGIVITHLDWARVAQAQPE